MIDLLCLFRNIVISSVTRCVVVVLNLSCDILLCVCVCIDCVMENLR